MNTPNTQKSHLGARFYNSDMELIESYQLLNSENVAMACCDFRNGKIERFDCSPAKIEQSKAWMRKLIEEHTNL